MSGQLDSKNTVITGAGAGVGRASALRFAKEGRVLCVPTWTTNGPRRPSN